MNRYARHGGGGKGAALNFLIFTTLDGRLEGEQRTAQIHTSAARPQNENIRAVLNFSSSRRHRCIHTCAGSFQPLTSSPCNKINIFIFLIYVLFTIRWRNSTKKNSESITSQKHNYVGNHNHHCEENSANKDVRNQVAQKMLSYIFIQFRQIIAGYERQNILMALAA